MMKSFFRDRGLWLAAVVLIMFAISLAQGGISYTMTFGADNDCGDGAGEPGGGAAEFGAAS